LGEDRGVELEVELSGLHLKNPVLVCSGTFGNGREYSEWMDLSQLGGLITKSVTLKPRAGNPPPRLWEVPYGLLNSIGLENKGLEVFLNEDLPWLHRQGLPVWVNVAGFSEEEYQEIAREVSGSKMASALELNVSCPNVKQGGIHFASNPVQAARLVSRVRDETDIPMYVKLSPRTNDMKEMARMMEKAGADGLSLINTMPAMALDVETARPRLGNITGGLSGPAIHPIAVMAVWEAAAEVDIPVIGMGGIWNWKDAAELLMVGADAVAVGTLNFLSPEAPLQILAGLRDFMERKGIKTVKEMVGKARKGSPDQPTWE
jgi:dihydroorotate dehydrogenase (NAD+) catalytic subunit